MTTASTAVKSKLSFRLAIIGLSYFGAHYLGYYFLEPVQRIATIWPASGFVLAVALLTPKRRWPATFAVLSAANLLSNYVSGAPLAAIVGFLTSTVLELSLGLLIMSRVCGREAAFTRIIDVLALIAVATFGNACSAFIGAAATAYSFGSSFWASYWTWWISNGLGILLVTPLIVSWAKSESRPRTERLHWLAEAAAAMAVSLALIWTYFGPNRNDYYIKPHSYMLLAPLAWAALRLGPRGAATTLALVAAVEIGLTKAGIGAFPLGGDNLEERILWVQLFIGFKCVISLLLAASFAERKSAEQTLRQSEERLRHVIEAGNDGIWEWDIATNAVAWSDRVYEMFKMTKESFGNTFNAVNELIHPDDLPGFTQALEGHLKQNLPFDLEIRFRCGNGSYGYFLCRSKAVRDGDGKPLLLIGSICDITERKQAEAALKTSEERLLATINSTPNVAVQWYDEKGRVILWNHASEIIFGWKAEEAVGKTLDQTIHTPEGAAEFLELLLVIKETGQTIGPSEYHFKRRDGADGICTSTTFALPSTDGNPCFVCMDIDVTERKNSQQALLESNAKLLIAMDVAKLGYWEYDVATNSFAFDENFYKLYGTTPAQEGGTFMSAEDYARKFIPPEEVSIVAKEIESALATTDPNFTRQIEHSIIRADGSKGYISVRYAIVKDSKGRTIKTYGANQDITDRRQIEEQFRQSQKMEAIGQLAGGVAHDFNNILGAIMMQAGLARSRDGLPLNVRELLNDIVVSAERAANLTRQLLAFSRRQVMQPRQLDLNEIVTSLAKMLQRILGEDVHMQLNLYPSPLIAHADAGMLDQVLMNLAVNARDAMPSGGQMVIETAAKVITEEEALSIPDASPGRYVCLRVSDAGCGIAPENLARIFEPFFTTKEAGKGTGLGLATVFGIVKQHRGSILVSSEVGRGTTFQVFLPTSDFASESLAEETVETESHGGTETILVVEDDPTVRKLMGILLEEYGYTVLEACSGVDALRVWEQYKGRVQLLLTDIVMPEGVSGRDLAAQLQDRDPKLKVIFTSGYSAELAGRELKLQEGQNFLQKPCPPDQILEAVRRSLDS